MQNSNRLTDIKNKFVVTEGEMEWGGTNQRYGIKRYKLLNRKETSNKDILYGTGNYTHYLVITYNAI